MDEMESIMSVNLEINSTDNSSTFSKVFDAGVVKVNSRSNHVAVIMEDGSLWTFGRNHRGQLERNET